MPGRQLLQAPQQSITNRSSGATWQIAVVSAAGSAIDHCLTDSTLIGGCLIGSWLVAVA